MNADAIASKEFRDITVLFTEFGIPDLILRKLTFRSLMLQFSSRVNTERLAERETLLHRLGSELNRPFRILVETPLSVQK